MALVTADGLNPDDYPPMDVHGILPWSVLRADSKPWQDRKKWWHSLGMDDMAGREDVSIFPADRPKGRHGTISGGRSRFDPVLAELMYTWYCPAGGAVLDPCAGGSVRGLVAAHLGHDYLGVDLSERQVDANGVQYAAWHHRGLAAGFADWVTGAAQEVLPGLEPGYDYALTCPPYHDLERYSDDPRDLSAMSWEEFVAAHEAIVVETMRLLADDALATWVVSDVRDKRGHLRGLPGLVAVAAGKGGAHLVNDQIMVTPVGSMHRLMRRRWSPTRGMTRVHQQVLTFVKGDRRRAAVKVRESRGGA